MSHKREKRETEIGRQVSLVRPGRVAIGSAPRLGEEGGGQRRGPACIFLYRLADKVPGPQHTEPFCMYFVHTKSRIRSYRVTIVCKLLRSPLLDTVVATTERICGRVLIPFLACH